MLPRHTSIPYVTLVPASFLVLADRACMSQAYGPTEVWIFAQVHDSVCHRRWPCQYEQNRHSWLVRHYQEMRPARPRRRRGSDSQRSLRSYSKGRTFSQSTFRLASAESSLCPYYAAPVCVSVQEMPRLGSNRDSCDQLAAVDVDKLCLRRPASDPLL